MNTKELRKGFGSAAGKAKQLEAYHKALNEAADEIDRVREKESVYVEEIDRLWKMIKHAQEVSNEAGLIGMVGSVAWSNQIKKAARDDVPSAWLVPKLLELSKADRVHFSRAEGNNSTDDELKELISGTVIYHAETVFLGDGAEYVEDKNGVKHYPEPLYKRKAQTK